MERELDYRSNDGIEVWLLWRQAEDELVVVVSDERSGEFFELATEAREALEVFEHPYAYAARLELTPAST
jgi:hypothetical protein